MRDVNVPYVTYWEHAPGQPIPPYVALALVSMRRALGDRLLLLTPRTVENYLGPDILERHWAFEPLAFNLAAGVEDIIAKSDFIRMAFVHRYGGAWVDADTLFLRDPSKVVFPQGISAKLHWHSECLFASQPGNPLLAQALQPVSYTHLDVYKRQPWNFPINQAMRKIAGALAAGCSIIIKAPEEAPGSVIELVRCFHDAGVPKGVLNLVFGIAAEVSDYLIRSPIIRKVSFTGSTEVGRQLGALAEEHLDKALGRSLWLEKAEMYPQKYPSIPPAGCAIENGDF